MTKIYTKASCSPCTTLKLYLQRKGVVYKEISFDEHPEQYPAGFSIFPLTEVNGRFIQGLNFRSLQEALNL